MKRNFYRLRISITARAMEMKQSPLHLVHPVRYHESLAVALMATDNDQSIIDNKNAYVNRRKSSNTQHSKYV